MTDHANATVWMDVQAPSYPPSRQDESTDVCVIGAGIAGLSTAYELSRAGRSVVVLDDGPVGGGMTRRTTAHLSNAIDDRYSNLIRLHGEDGAKLAADSQTAAIDRIESIANDERIACDFERVDGYLLAANKHNRDVLERELDAANRAGLTAVEMAPRAPLPVDTGPCLRFPRQAQFHPAKYVAGLAEAVIRLGGRIYCGTHADTIEGGRTARVVAASGSTVTADAIVVATNTPVNDRLAIHTKQAPYTTYVAALRIPRGAVRKALYWDTADPYHYVRLHDDGAGELLIVGGEDHKSGEADDARERFDRLEQWIRSRVPMAGAVALQWSGQVMEPTDGVAFIGRNPGDEPNVYVATGDSGMGITHGAIAGLLLTDLITQRPAPWAALYDPSRKMLRTPLAYAKENAEVAARYVEDRLTGGDVGSVDDLRRGQGAIVRRGLHKIAAYRDDDGRLHERSAVCPHLGCLVAFDAVEKTWDCPCHGSRFDRFGRVIVGPANRDLARVTGTDRPPP